MLPVSPMSAPATAHGARSVPTEGRTLPLVSTHLAAETRGGLARLTFTQRFRNVHALPLAVSYSLPLPADAAVSGFAITIGARRIVGEIDRRAAARERYEDALIQGRTAGLLEQERSSLFTQELGNVPPGADVLVEVLLDQRLAWLDEGWELRFPHDGGPPLPRRVGPRAGRRARDARSRHRARRRASLALPSRSATRSRSDACPRPLRTRSSSARRTEPPS
jgi:Ca-activated chloride channel family protein